MQSGTIQPVKWHYSTSKVALFNQFGASKPSGWSLLSDGLEPQNVENEAKNAEKGDKK